MDKLLIIFSNCKGLGIQSGKSIARITSDLYQINLNVNTIFVVDDNGAFLCSLLKNREEYESINNQDRRIHNLRNGFIITWNNDATECYVYKENKRKTFLIRYIRIVAIFIIALTLGLLMGFSIWEDSRHIAELEYSNETFKTTNEKLKREVAYLNQKIEPYSEQIHLDSVKSISYEMKKKLHSLDCDIHTVSNVREWWQSLSSAEQSTALEIYDFNIALTQYNQFFNSRNLFDLYFLARNKVNVFSKEQSRILRISGKCRKSGAKSIQLRNMNFKEIDAALKRITYIN